jgi:hypothetical protein
MRRVVAVGLLGAIALAAGLSGSAGAGVGAVATESLGSSHGLRYLLGTWAEGPWTDLVVQAGCPAGRPAVGGGVDVAGPPRLSRWSASSPFDGEDPDGDANDQWYAEGQNLPGTQRQFRVYAVCGPPGLGDVTYVFNKTEPADGEARSLNAVCDPGTVPIGGGALLSDGTITRSTPLDGPDRNRRRDSWRVTGRNLSGVEAELFAAAICLDAGPRQVKYVTASRRVRSGKAGAVRATCPPSRAIAGGGFTVDGVEESFGHALVPRDSAADRNDVPDDRWQATVVNGTSARADAKATAVCIR